MSNFFESVSVMWLNLYLDIVILLFLLESIYGRRLLPKRYAAIKYIAPSSILLFMFFPEMRESTTPFYLIYILALFVFGCFHSLLLRDTYLCKLLTLTLVTSIWAEIYLYAGIVSHLFGARNHVLIYLSLIKIMQIPIMIVVGKFPIHSPQRLPRRYSIVIVLSVFVNIGYKVWIFAIDPTTMRLLLMSMHILLYLSLAHITQNYRTRFNLLNNQISMQLESWNELEEIYQELKKLRHDMKNHMLCVQSLLEAEDYEQLNDYLCALNDRHLLNKKIVQTGIPVFDAVLNAKCSQCTVQDIPVDIDIFFAGSTHMCNINNHDICAILCNLIDNAIEASVRTDRPDLKIKIMEKNALLMIKISNRYDEDILAVNPSFTTTKKDPSLHGMGVKIVKQIVAKHGGVFTYSYKKGYVHANVSLPVELRTIEYNAELITSTTTKP